MLYWVDDYYLQMYLADHGIKPVAENETTAFYIYDKRFIDIKERYYIKRMMQRSHKFED